MSSAADQVCRLTQNVARNCGYAVFPVGEDKRPLLKGWPERATTGADRIADQWHLGALIGIATGLHSDVSVLDDSVRHLNGSSLVFAFLSPT